MRRRGSTNQHTCSAFMSLPPPLAPSQEALRTVSVDPKQCFNWLEKCHPTPFQPLVTAYITALETPLWIPIHSSAFLNLTEAQPHIAQGMKHIPHCCKICCLFQLNAGMSVACRSCPLIPPLE